MSTEARKGDTVKVKYTGKLEDGTVFDSTEERGPLEFTIGDGKLIKGFEEAAVGMKTGEKKTFTLSPEQAYGEVSEDSIFDVERDRFTGKEPQLNKAVKIPQSDGSNVIAEVVEITDTHLKLDTNHPLAGKHLTFEVELVEISQPENK